MAAGRVEKASNGKSHFASGNVVFSEKVLYIHFQVLVKVQHLKFFFSRPSRRLFLSLSLFASNFIFLSTFQYANQIVDL